PGASIDRLGSRGRRSTNRGHGEDRSRGCRGGGPSGSGVERGEALPARHRPRPILATALRAGQRLFHVYGFGVPGFFLEAGPEGRSQPSKLSRKGNPEAYPRVQLARRLGVGTMAEGRKREGTVRKALVVLLGALLLLPLGATGAQAAKPEKYDNTFFNAYWNSRRKVDNDTYLRTTWYSGVYLS